MSNWHFGHAKAIVRDTLLGEVESLKARLPDTETCRRNISRIEAHKAPSMMSDQMLRDYVNLLRRSIVE